MRRISLKTTFSIAFILIILSGFYSKILADETLTWVYMAEAEPECWERDGVAKGIQPEIVDYLCSRLGIKVVHKFYPWERAQKMVEIGKVDAMLTTPTVSRFAYCVFGKENGKPAYWNIFYQKSKTDIAEKVKKLTSLEDLKPFRILDFIGNGWTASFLKEGFNIHFVAEIEQIPLMLANGRQDLCVNSATMINYWAKKNNVADQIEMHRIEWPWTRFHYVFMVSRKSPWVQKGLVRALDEELKKMKQSGEWIKILKKYENPHGFGESFVSTLDKAYLTKGGFYKEYDNYPIYKKTNH